MSFSNAPMSRSERERLWRALELYRYTHGNDEHTPLSTNKIEEQIKGVFEDREGQRSDLIGRNGLNDFIDRKASTHIKKLHCLREYLLFTGVVSEEYLQRGSSLPASMLAMSSYYYDADTLKPADAEKVFGECEGDWYGLCGVLGREVLVSINFEWNPNLAAFQAKARIKFKQKVSDRSAIGSEKLISDRIQGFAVLSRKELVLVGRHVVDDKPCLVILERVEHGAANIGLIYSPGTQEYSKTMDHPEGSIKSSQGIAARAPTMNCINFSQSYSMISQEIYQLIYSSELQSPPSENQNIFVQTQLDGDSHGQEK